jgi:Arc/MetJ family transcription regulator
MRTTIRIDDALHRQLKEIAARQGKTLSALVNDLLYHALIIQSKREAYKLDLEGWDGQLQPGDDILDRETLFDLFNGC